ncbi:MAG: thermonuclease family protein [Bryobacteraceae bacterium]
MPDGRVANHEIVRAGLAWWFRKYAPNDDVLGRLEGRARRAGRGLWGVANPIPPWDWRRGARAATTE